MEDHQEHPIQSLMKTAMESIKGMVEVNTIVGDAVETPDGKVIIPISRVSFGFAAGGSEFETQNEQKPQDNSDSLPFGGGSGAGVSVQPVAFLVVGDDQVRLLTVDDYPLWDRLIDVAPNLFDSIKSMTSQSDEDQNSQEGTNTNPDSPNDPRVQ
ncbi:GerW family sporulation protein [Natranaerobius thermophilus]|uniref:Sporulation protein YtfJ n=1 Tax=Natranaerobius thermophilus (strain ATCC BAA-1301 / DSM 18059 / JW/NM-WN-LF) TaxID=457570 RepID=B2A4K1_NATTJ|nr:GerW family sporulation protein [Natranaerobius thermophilus]ACB85223.1 sporulation protein YtfJ [Natranaerobius thermophilus JW/NM-WN-LF]